MSSPDSCSDVNFFHKGYRDPDESHTEPQAKCTLLSDPSCASVGSAGPRIKTIAPNKHFIRDTNQQILVLKGSTLVTAPDKHGKRGGDPRIFLTQWRWYEIFYVSTLRQKKASGSKKNCIVLAVSEGKLYLCCGRVKRPKCPSLELKKIQEELSSLSSEKLLSFTFLKEKAGSYFTLESAANPGYFVCTGSVPGQPVGVTKELGKHKNTQFEFVNANVDLSEMED